MRPTELEEWQKLQAIQPLLRRLVDDGITRREYMPHLLTQYKFLRDELDQLVISVPTDRDVDQGTIQDLKAEITKLFNIVGPIVRRTSLNSTTFIDVHTGCEEPAAGPATLGALSLSNAKSILPPLISFKERITATLVLGRHSI